MDNQIKISDFVKLTRSTLKTVLYYHKIGLLQEPKRSANGYRLYGAEELARMRMIKHFKQIRARSETNKRNIRRYTES